MMILYKHEVTVSTVRLMIASVFITLALTTDACYRWLLTAKVDANIISYMHPVCALRFTLEDICLSVYGTNYKHIVRCLLKAQADLYQYNFANSNVKILSFFAFELSLLPLKLMSAAQFASSS